MYGLTPYQLSGIQIGIQFGHAVVEYGQKMKYIGEHNQSLNTQYNDWADNWKTFIILNGGISNHSQNRYSDEDYVGTMEQNLKTLEDNGVEVGNFYEPDLNDMLSGIVFIVDERVFNKKDYPDFSDWLMSSKYAELIRTFDTDMNTIAEYIKNSTNKEDQKVYKEWVNFIGGEKNVFLRDFLKNFRLA